MTDLNRLEVIAPRLSKLLRAADPVKQQALKLAACKYVMPLLDPTDGKLVSGAVAELLQTGRLPKETREKLEDLAYSFDEQYFPLYEADPNNEAAYMPFFRQACILHAVSYAGEDDPYQSASESIYEAAQALGKSNCDPFLQYLESIATSG
jgi:hypothetical protein